MSAQIIQLVAVKTTATLVAPPHSTIDTSFSGIARYSWQRLRLTVEVIGWIVIAASLIAALWL